MKVAASLKWIALMLCVAGCATPPPTGPHAVGRAERRLVDAARSEGATSAPDDLRETPLVVWHPAASGSGRRSAYFPGLAAIQSTMGRSGEVSPVEVFALRFVPSGERTEAAFPEGSGRYPVVLLSPGAGTNVEFYDTLAADLASHGYIVVGVNHPYDVAAVLLSDGRTAGFLQGPFAMEERRSWVAGRVAVRTADLGFALEAIRRDPVLGSRADFARVGVMGHSLGGIAAAQACHVAAIRSCLNLDGLQRGGPFGVEPVSSPPSRPFMLITKESRIPESSLALFRGSTSSAYLVTVAGVDHDGFTDGGVIAPLPQRGRAAERLGTIRRYVRTFFDQTLKDEDAALDMLSGTPDAHMDAFGPRAASRTR